MTTPLVSDRVLETSTTTGTGNLTLAGAVVGHQSFATAYPSGATVYYCVTDGTLWECGVGLYTTPTTLARTTVTSGSSGAGVNVTFGAGSKNVFNTLTANGLAPLIAGLSNHAFNVYLSAATAMTLNTWKKLPLDTKVFDTGGEFDNVSNFRFQPIVAGYYQLNGGAEILSTGQAQCAIYKNGSALRYGPYITGTTSICYVNVSDVVFLNGSTDYVEFWGWSSSTVNSGSGPTNVSFSGALLGNIQIAGTPHGFMASASGATTLTTLTSVKIHLGNVVFDTDGWFDPTTNWRFQPLIPGYYFVTGSVAQTGSSENQASIAKNGSIIVAGTYTTSIGTTGRSIVQAPIYFNGTSDYVELYGYSNGGGSTLTGFGTYLSAFLLSASTGGPIPINSQSANYTTTANDANGCISHPAADTTPRTMTIDSNANVPLQIGTSLTFDNEFGAGVMTIAITSDTLEFVGPSGSTGSRTLGSGGQATAIKKTATKWRINGTGLT